jgi:hypothetical protein
MLEEFGLDSCSINRTERNSCRAKFIGMVEKLDTNLKPLLPLKMATTNCYAINTNSFGNNT